MYLSSTRTAELWPDTLRGALRAIAIAAVFWALAATLLYVLSPGLDTWPRLLVFHECVGMTMVACVLLLRRMRAFSRFRPMTRWVLTGVIAIPTGFVVGHQFAFLMLGEPLRMVGYLSVSLIPVLFTLLVGGVGLHYYATREQLATEAAARSEAQRLAVDAQLRLLRAQLEPHMLFNTLANLRSLVREDADRAESMIDQLIVYLRSALAASQTESVALSREFAQLRAYLDIMSLRMGPRLTYRWTCRPNWRPPRCRPCCCSRWSRTRSSTGWSPRWARAASRWSRARHRVTAGIEIRVNDSGLGLPRGRGGRTRRPPRRSQLWPAACARPAAGRLRPGRPAQPRAAPSRGRQRAGVHPRLTRRNPVRPLIVVIDPSRGTSMTLATAPTAVIAEDEPVLARTLSRLLEQVWPELRIVGVAEDGLRATELGLAQAPDVMFLDIKMPGRTGLEVAEAVADDWPDDRAEPLFVFITAYDSFAVPAFERAAVDYLLKPATAERLQQTVERLKARLAGRATSRCGRPGRADAARCSRSRLRRPNRASASRSSVPAWATPCA